jgi:hypothetical protein
MEINIVGPNDSTVAGVVLDAGQLDKVMAGLADIRQKMTPEVPQQFPQGQPTHKHESTKYQFGLDPFSGAPVLSFRSPAFGWLTFHLVQDELEKMVSLLKEARGRVSPHTDTRQ